jgi:hypothetical protein
VGQGFLRVSAPVIPGRREAANPESKGRRNWLQMPMDSGLAGFARAPE